MKKYLSMMAVTILTVCIFASCDDDKTSSPLTGTWESVGYYTNYSTSGNLISDTSEKITFNSNGKGVYTANDTKKEFTWNASDIAVEISIAPSIHNQDNYDYPGREYDLLSSTQLVIYWSNARIYVYEKV